MSDTGVSGTNDDDDGDGVARKEDAQLTLMEALNLDEEGQHHGLGDQ